MTGITETASWPAPAKLNLLLEITGRRSDGYHCLQTVFQLLDWGDSLHFELSPDVAVTRVNALAGVAPDADLAVRAARLLQSHCRVRHGVRIRLDKRIPLGGGLGGASSDAATTLVALNQLWGCGLDHEQLASLGLRLGADVPVFVHGYSAWAEGVGEQLQPLALGERHYVLLMPGLHAATAELFAEPGLQRNCPPRRPFVPPHLPPAGAVPPNVFAPLVLRRFAHLAESFRNLDDGLVPRLSGTGSTWFFCVADAGQADRLTTRLKSLYNSAAVEVRAVRGVDESPLHRRVGQEPPVSSSNISKR